MAKIQKKNNLKNILEIPRFVFRIKVNGKINFGITSVEKKLKKRKGKNPLIMKKFCFWTHEVTHLKNNYFMI